MIEGADLQFVASLLVTHYSLVLVWMVETLHCGVTLVALDSTRTSIPRHAIHKCVTILRGILKQVWWSSKVPHVVSIDAALRIV